VRRLFPLVLVLLAGCAEGGPLGALRPGVAEGREALAHLDGGRPEAAEAAFVAGLAEPDVPRDVAARLWHGLGVVRARLDADAPADSAFAEALALAHDPARRARYAYDAGTAALAAGDAGRAVRLLRQSLVLDPGRADARRNVEVALRRLHDERPAEPSPRARQIKARADSLVAARQYRAALDVMEGGLTRDSSLAAYADFVGRLQGVVSIEEGGE
jgi:Tfp pilus assembly protein PilF